MHLNKSNTGSAKIILDPKEIDNTQGGKGLEICIKGLIGNPEETQPSTSIFIEKYEGNILCHIWTNNKHNSQTIELT